MCSKNAVYASLCCSRVMNEAHHQLFIHSSLSWMQHHHMIRRLWWQWRFISLSSTTCPHQRAVSHKHGAPVSSLWADKEPDKSAAWADLFTHKYQRAEQSGAMCDLRGSRAAIIIYRCGPAALKMEAAEGALTRNRLICCQTTNPTFDAVCFLLIEVVSLQGWFTVLSQTTDFAAALKSWSMELVLQNMMCLFWKMKMMFMAVAI